jgi:L-rhamnose isomerase/sugar isomerase
VKDPLEDLLQSVEAILLAYAQALGVDMNSLANAQESNDAALAQEILQDTFRTDMRPLVAEARLRDGGTLHPLRFFREKAIRRKLVDERGTDTKATGL